MRQQVAFAGKPANASTIDTAAMKGLATTTGVVFLAQPSPTSAAKGAYLGSRVLPPTSLPPFPYDAAATSPADLRWTSKTSS